MGTDDFTEIMNAADHLIDIGPEAGTHGGISFGADWNGSGDPGSRDARRPGAVVT